MLDTCRVPQCTAKTVPPSTICEKHPRCDHPRCNRLAVAGGKYCTQHTCSAPGCLRESPAGGRCERHLPCRVQNCRQERTEKNRGSGTYEEYCAYRESLPDAILPDRVLISP